MHASAGWEGGSRGRGVQAWERRGGKGEGEKGGFYTGCKGGAARRAGCSALATGQGRGTRRRGLRREVSRASRAGVHWRKWLATELAAFADCGGRLGAARRGGG